MTTASWLKRVFAYLIDMHISMVFLVLAYLASTSAGRHFNAGAALAISIGLYVVWYAIGFYNRCVRMGRLGHSWGRDAVGINLISERSRQPIGIGKAFVRENCHFLDAIILGFGYLLPIWDQKRQTLADKIMGTVTVEGDVPALGAPADRGTAASDLRHAGADAVVASGGSRSLGQASVREAAPQADRARHA